MFSRTGRRIVLTSALAAAGAGDQRLRRLQRRQLPHRPRRQQTSAGVSVPRRCGAASSST